MLQLGVSSCTSNVPRTLFLFIPYVVFSDIQMTSFEKLVDLLFASTGGVTNLLREMRTFGGWRKLTGQQIPDVS